MSKNETITVNNDASRLTVGILYVVALIIALGGAIYTVTNERNQIYNVIAGNRQETQQQFIKVTATLTAITASLERFNAQLVKGTGDRYTRKDAALDCAMLALANKGFVCHNPLSPEPQYYQVGLGSWKSTIKR
jgi:flagellar basal body-associated protein FliL